MILFSVSPFSSDRTVRLRRKFVSYQVGFEDIAGGVDGGLVLWHEEHGQQVAGEAQGQDQGQQLPYAKKQARRNV
jgi:hypothetical protein